MYAPKNIIERTTSLISELQAYYELKDEKLDTLQIEILQYIAAHPNLTAYKIWNKKVFRKSWDKEIGKRWVSSRISGLKKIGLIEMKSCRLTISGLVYLIQEKEIMYNDVIRGILRHYNNNTLFELFVYPYIEQQTLPKLKSLNSLSPLSLFLNECCRELVSAIHTINTTKNRYVTEELKWQSLPDDKHSTNRLNKFLKRELNLNWIDRARIERIWGFSTLRISFEDNSILIGINDDRTKALVKMKGKIKYEFKVKNYDRNNEDSQRYLYIELSQVTVNEGAANFAIGFIRSRVPNFIFSLIMSVTPASEDFRILSQDKKFMNTVEDTKRKFLNQCELLVKMGDGD